jgi:hypothetical protein
MSDSKGLKLMDTSLVFKKDHAPSFQFIHNTYTLHLVTLNSIAASFWTSYDRIGTYLGKLLEISLKGLKLMVASLVFKKDHAPSFQFVHNTSMLSLVTS